MADVYEWDDDKANQNFQKHGVEFSEAIRVFDDLRAIEGYDADHSMLGEYRFWRIGFSGVRLLYVVFTVRENKTRIIHARNASDFMEKMYAEANKLD